MTRQTVLLCAGGTGGHVFPALSLAQDLIDRDFNVVLVTDIRAKKFAQGLLNLKIEVISSSTFPPSVIGKLKALLSLGHGYIQSRRILKKYNPAVVVGFGGYPSLPSMVAAQRRNIKTIIHEANAVLGRANKFLAKKADKIALSLPDISTFNDDDNVRVIMTGNPVRADITALYTHGYNTPEPNEHSFNLLIMGGSLGAKVMAKYVPEALTALPNDLRNQLNVVQQCHADDIPYIQSIYDDANIKATLKPFFDNIPALLKTSHLIIARSGASTVSEIAVAGIPAIYIPYPHHADQQQKINAESIAKFGGAWVMEEHLLSSDLLSAKIKQLMESPELLFKAAEAARSCAKPEAARKLGNLVVALIKGWDSV